MRPGRAARPRDAGAAAGPASRRPTAAARRERGRELVQAVDARHLLNQVGLALHVGVAPGGTVTLWPSSADAGSKPRRSGSPPPARAGCARRAAAPAARGAGSLGAARPGADTTSSVPGTKRAPHRSTISSRRPLGGHACSKCSCFSKRADASVRRPSPRDVRMMFGPTQVAASISTRVVLSETSEIWPPMIPAMPLGPSASHTERHRESKRALHTVERRPSSRRRCARRTTIASRDLVQVECVQRLAVREHHVVGDVDDVRDRPLAGGQEALLEPQRRGADLTSSNTRAVKRRQTSGSDIDATWS